MSWLRVGDNAATNPIVLRVRSLVRGSKLAVPEADFAPCEVFGFVTLCATLAAGHGTDYVISYGTACTVSPARADRLLDLACKSGYMTKGKGGADPTWVIIDDPEFIHMRTTAELAWEAQRKADAGNTALVVAVRLRDGDACRYCGRTVRWNDKRGGGGATYDHRVPGQPATFGTYVVACRQCNGLRGDDPAADERVPLLDPPARPYFSESTLAFLAGKRKDLLAEDQRPGNPPGDANRELATSQSTHPRHDGAPAAGRSAETADVRGAGSGDVGSGRYGSGRSSESLTPAFSGDSRKRSRRGGRGGGSGR